MKALATVLKCAVTAFFLAGAGSPVFAQAKTMDELFAELAEPGNPEWRRAESDIQREWSKSGSPALDLLLKRGEDAMEAGDTAAAIEHLTALTDQAPDFAEGWNARATAYFRAGYYGPAISDIERVLALEPRHFGALAGLGMILAEIGDTSDAIKAFRAAHEIHPNQPDLSETLESLETSLKGTAL
jgi:tetratricopeptide (TPR) repeat protein